MLIIIGAFLIAGCVKKESPPTIQSERIPFGSIDYQVEADDTYGKLFLEITKDNIFELLPPFSYYIYQDKYESYKKRNPGSGLYPNEYNVKDCSSLPIKDVLTNVGKYAINITVHPRSVCLYNKKIASILLSFNSCYDVQPTEKLDEFEESDWNKFVYACDTERAVYYVDPSICSRILPSYERNLCFAEVGPLYKDASACNELPTQYWKDPDYCKKEGNSYSDREECFILLGMNLRDASVCEFNVCEEQRATCKATLKEYGI